MADRKQTSDKTDRDGGQSDTSESGNNRKNRVSEARPHAREVHSETLSDPSLAWPGNPTYRRRERILQGTPRGLYTGRGPKGYQRADERIQEDACERLTHHGGVDARGIEVSVKNGEITLEGTIDSRRSKRMAEDALETVTGMKDIHNRLHLKGQDTSSSNE